jgi:hypothetical protein
MPSSDRLQAFASISRHSSHKQVRLHQRTGYRGRLEVPMTETLGLTER